MQTVLPLRSAEGIGSRPPAGLARLGSSAATVSQTPRLAMDASVSLQARGKSVACCADTIVVPACRAQD